MTFRKYGTTKTGSMVHLVKQLKVLPESHIEAVCNCSYRLTGLDLFITDTVPDMLCNHCKKYLKEESK